MENLFKQIPQKDGGVIIYDGLCVICSKFMKLVLAKDDKKYFKFTSIQSEFGQNLIKSNGLTGNSIIVVENGIVYQQSDAILQIAAHLKGWMKFLSYFKFVPKILRDRVYQFIANRRYGWFGKLTVCEVPSAAFKARLLND